MTRKKVGPVHLKQGGITLRADAQATLDRLVAERGKTKASRFLGCSDTMIEKLSFGGYGQNAARMSLLEARLLEAAYGE